MVRFSGLCDGKIMVRKTFFCFLCGNVLVFRKNVGACYLIVSNQRVIKNFKKFLKHDRISYNSTYST